jgi:hypothetical protein
MTTTKYDDTLIDDASHPLVVRARDLGRDWAEREWDACEPDQRGQAWYPIDVDARPLVSGLDDEDDDHELATICNAAAGERWSRLAKVVSIVED